MGYTNCLNKPLAIQYSTVTLTFNLNSTGILIGKFLALVQHELHQDEFSGELEFQ